MKFKEGLKGKKVLKHHQTVECSPAKRALQVGGQMFGIPSFNFEFLNRILWDRIKAVVTCNK